MDKPNDVATFESNYDPQITQTVVTAGRLSADHDVYT